MEQSNLYVLPAIIIRRDVLFPHVVNRFLTISKERNVNCLNNLDIKLDSKTDINKQLILLFQRDKDDLDDLDLNSYYPSALLVNIKKAWLNKDSAGKTNWVLDLEGLNFVDISLIDLNKKLNYLDCTFSIKTPPIFVESQESLTYISLIKQICQKYADINLLNQDMIADINKAENGQFAVICYHLISILLRNSKELLDIAFDVARTNSFNDILRITYDFLSKDLSLCQVRLQTTKNIQEETNKINRDFALRQQLKFIQEELNEPLESDLGTLKEKIINNVPERHHKELLKEFARLQKLSPLAPDYATIRTYLEVITELPWNKSTVDNFDLVKARQILDEDHYGLEKVKDRIIEFIAVKAFAPNAKSPIICFVGPPGVGKTSLGQSIARTLGRKFERIALGGLHDEAELRGHRRTYIGSLPGKIITAVKRAGSNNPLILLDEVDKISAFHKGDPSAALLEILDPEQNKTFKDNYLDIDFDLSNVTFICTANSLDTISDPLLDRMEVIPLSSYTETEKVYIAQKHLIPKQLKEIVLDSKYFNLSEEMIRYIIFNYAPEAGVRRLEQLVATLVRKVLVELTTCNFDSKVIKKKKIGKISKDNIRSYLGVERPFDRNKREVLDIGTSIGLGWSPVGGSLLYIEAITTSNPKELLTTGSIGDSMSESTKIALSYIKANARRYGLDTSSVASSGIHIHFPEGAVKKDGPSAGIAITTALFSLFSDQPMKKDIAMTGEITLSGLVLPIGGLKEKSIAAMKAGLKTVLIPKANQPDLSEFPEELLKNIKFVTVEKIDDVLSNVFENFVLKNTLNTNMIPYRGALGTNLDN